MNVGKAAALETFRGRVLLAGAMVTLTALAPVATAEVAQKGPVRVSVRASLVPRALPRTGTAPVSVSFAGNISPTSSGVLPRLRAISISINSHGRLSTRGLPRCGIKKIDPSPTREALSDCRSSLIGEGDFSAHVDLPEQSPFPSEGRMLAFNGRYQGKPAILAHIYGTDPVPTSYVLPFTIRSAEGTYGTVLRASLPKVTGDWGFVTGISMTLGRTFALDGELRGYISAGCPAPRGFPGVVFAFARTAFDFEGGPKLTSVLNRSCIATGQ